MPCAPCCPPCLTHAACSPHSLTPPFLCLPFTPYPFPACSLLPAIPPQCLPSHYLSPFCYSTLLRLWGRQQWQAQPCLAQLGRSGGHSEPGQVDPEAMPEAEQKVRWGSHWQGVDCVVSPQMAQALTPFYCKLPPHHVPCISLLTGFHLESASSVAWSRISLTNQLVVFQIPNNRHFYY